MSATVIGEINGSLEAAWPVGSVYLSMVTTNPAILLGFGVWSSIGSGRALVGIDNSQVEFDTLGKTGGAKTHTLTTAELPAHAHVQQAQGGTTASNSGTNVMTSAATGGSLRSSAQSTLNAGSGNSHNNLQPFIVVAVWQRIA